MTTHEVDRVGDRIFLVTTAYLKGLGRTIPGATFSKVGGPHWSLPLDLPTCYALRERFGTGLRVGADLSAWARAEIERQTTMGALGASADAELMRVPEVSPVLSQAMSARIYQRVGARFIAEAAAHGSGGVLIADQPGLGKTLEAIGGIIESGIPGPYLVICPKTAVETVWAREIPRWWPGAQVRTVPDGRAKRDAILNEFAGTPTFGMDPTFLVVHPEMIRVKSWWVCGECGQLTRYAAGPKRLKCKLIIDGVDSGMEVWHDPQLAKRRDDHEFPQLFDIDWGFIIADESDRILLRKNAQLTFTRTGAELLRLREGGMSVAMSGTPFRGRPHLLWGTLNWLRPKSYSAFWRWAETYYEVGSGWGGTRTIGRMREDRAETMTKQLSDIMIRRTKAEVAQDLPAKTYVGTPLLDGDPRSPVGVWLPMTGAQQRLYDQMATASVATMSGGELNAIGILAELTRLKQFASAAGRMDGDVFRPQLPSNKLEYVMEKLEEMGLPDDPETKVVIASQFTQILNMFRTELARTFGDKQVVMVTGEVTGKKRPEAIDAFNAEVGVGPHIMLLQTKTGGVSITLDTADHTFFLDETWIPDDQEQVEDRTHRVSRPRPVYYHYLRSVGTVEESIAVVNAERAEETRDILDTARGVEYARQVVETMRLGRER